MKAENRHQSQGRIVKATTGAKAQDRRQSCGHTKNRASKLRTGDKSQDPVVKPRTGGRAVKRLTKGFNVVKKLRPDIEPRTGVYVHPAHQASKYWVNI